MFLIRRPGLGLQMMVICFIIACQAAAFLLPPPRAVPPRAGTGVTLPRPSRLTMSAETPKAEWVHRGVLVTQPLLEGSAYLPPHGSRLIDLDGPCCSVFRPAPASLPKRVELKGLRSER